MIKSELVLKIAEQNPHLYQRDVENIVNAILDTIADALARGDRVELRGFGAFSVKKRDARTGRNPRTGETVAVANRAPVTLSFDPFSPTPMFSTTMPLFALIFIAVAIGVLIGGVASWFAQSKHRRLER